MLPFSLAINQSPEQRIPSLSAFAISGNSLSLVMAIKCLEDKPFTQYSENVAVAVSPVPTGADAAKQVSAAPYGLKPRNGCQAPKPAG